MPFRLADWGYTRYESGYLDEDGEYVSKRAALEDARGMSVEEYAKLSSEEQREHMEERYLDEIVPAYMQSIAEGMAEKFDLTYSELVHMDDWHMIQDALMGTKEERSDMMQTLYAEGYEFTADELAALYED